MPPSPSPQPSPPWRGAVVPAGNASSRTGHSAGRSDATFLSLRRGSGVRGTARRASSRTGPIPELSTRRVFLAEPRVFRDEYEEEFETIWRIVFPVLFPLPSPRLTPRRFTVTQPQGTRRATAAPNGPGKRSTSAQGPAHPTPRSARQNRQSECARQARRHILLRSGWHGIHPHRRGYNEQPITIAAEPGNTPQVAGSRIAGPEMVVKG